jgi:zinc protease
VTRIPEAGALPVVRLDDVADVTTPGGVRVVSVRRPNVPLAQLRLFLPLGEVALRDAATLRLLPKMLLAGTARRTGSEVAAELQRLGALVGAGADVDDLTVSAGLPSSVLREGLVELADIVARPSFPQREVVGERERVVQEVLQEAVDPVAIATHALGTLLFPRHPYGGALPEVATVRRTGRARLLRFHTDHVLPASSVLVAVGDVHPGDVADLADAVLGGWAAAGGGAGPTGDLPAPAPAGAARTITLVHRPGAVQSNVRLGARCAGRDDPGFPALFLAATIFGGHFTSRLVDNLRERHGYTYSPRAGIDERRLAAAFVVKAEVGTDVTAAALNEIRYELARMATTDVTPEELGSARRYVTGVLAMAAATQAGLAGLLGAFVSTGLEPTYLERFTRELAAVDEAAVREAAARFLGPAAMTTVVVGDADAVGPGLGPLGEVTVVS